MTRSEEANPTPGIIRFLQKSKAALSIANEVLIILKDKEPVKRETMPDLTEHLTELLIEVYRETESLAKMMKSQKFKRVFHDIKKRITKL